MIFLSVYILVKGDLWFNLGGVLVIKEENIESIRLFPILGVWSMVLMNVYLDKD
jgi:hypothetical protein